MKHLLACTFAPIVLASWTVASVHGDWDQVKAEGTGIVKIDKEPWPLVAQREPGDRDATAGSGGWMSLFNGEDLTGWTPKITGHAPGDNYGNTFRVEDGILKVCYDRYDKFDRRFGNLFYEKPFSNYVMRVEYRFVGDQCPGGPGWAFRNSGVMIHGQSPESMTKDQDFPASMFELHPGSTVHRHKTQLDLLRRRRFTPRMPGEDESLGRRPGGHRPPQMDRAVVVGLIDRATLPTLEETRGACLID